MVAKAEIDKGTITHQKQPNKPQQLEVQLTAWKNVFAKLYI